VRRVASIAGDNLLDVDFREGPQGRIRKIAPRMIERRRSHPSGRIFRAERVGDQNAVLRAGFIDPVVTLEVPLALFALDMVPDREDTGHGEARLRHAAKVFEDRLAGLGRIQEKLRSDAWARQQSVSCLFARHLSGQGIQPEDRGATKTGTPRYAVDRQFWHHMQKLTGRYSLISILPSGYQPSAVTENSKPLVRPVRLEQV
jgi:hypothetical protein